MTSVESRTLRAAVFALLLLLPSIRATAAGLDVPDLGAASLGKGAADAAAPSTLMAIYYNPAGLADQQGFRFLIDARGLQEITTFQRVAVGVENPPDFASVTDQGNKATGGFLVAPAFGLSYGFKLGIPWTIALGGMPPAGYSNDEYPNYFAIRGMSPNNDSTATQTAALQSPQRYTLISQTTTGYVLSLSLAAAPLPFLSLGAQLQAPIYSFNTTQALYLYSRPGESAAYDAQLGVKAMNAFNPSGAFGVSAKLPFGIQIGATYQLPTTIVGHGTMDITVPQSSSLYAITKVNAPGGNDLDLTIHLPWMGRIGVRIDRPLFELEADAVYEAWSQYKDITLTPHDISVTVQASTKQSVTTNVGTTVLPTGMVDAYSIRLGGELRPGALAEAASFLKIRAGVIYESSAVPIQYTSLNEINWDRIIPTVGLGFAIWKFDLDVAYAHAFQPERIVQDSQVLQSTGGATPTIVGNGNYTVNINMLALALSGHFG
jgi:long-subunit fatty acid transport protein